METYSILCNISVCPNIYFYIWKNRLEEKKENISNLLQKAVDAEVVAEKEKLIEIKKQT